MTPPRGRRRAGTVLLAGGLLAAALVSAPGCATWRGAQLYRSGTAALDRGDSARAIADLERAASLVPHASEIQNHLGLAYAAAGRETDALRALRRAVELDCENAAAAANLRRLEISRGNAVSEASPAPFVESPPAVD